MVWSRAWSTSVDAPSSSFSSIDGSTTGSGSFKARSPPVWLPKPTRRSSRCRPGGTRRSSRDHHGRGGGREAGGRGAVDSLGPGRRRRPAGQGAARDVPAGGLPGDPAPRGRDGKTSCSSRGRSSSVTPSCRRASASGCPARSKCAGEGRRGARRRLRRFLPAGAGAPRSAASVRFAPGSRRPRGAARGPSAPCMVVEPSLPPGRARSPSDRVADFDARHLCRALTRRLVVATAGRGRDRPRRPPTRSPGRWPGRASSATAERAGAEDVAGARGDRSRPRSTPARRRCRRAAAGCCSSSDPAQRDVVGAGGQRGADLAGDDAGEGHRGRLAARRRGAGTRRRSGRPGSTRPEPAPTGSLPVTRSGRGQARERPRPARACGG